MAEQTLTEAQITELENQIKESDISVWQQNGENYCACHALKILFHYDVEALNAVIDGTDTSFKDVDGVSYDIIHEMTVSNEQEAGEIIPLEGISCDCCGTELVAPMDEYSDDGDDNNNNNNDC